MRLHHTHSDFVNKLAHIQDLTDPLVDLERAARTRFASTARDGYPTSSSTADRQPPATQYDEVYDDAGNLIEKVPMPPRSDPTANAALADVDQDPIGKALRDAFTDLEEAEKRVVHATAALTAALTPAPDVDETSRDWCWLCSRIGHPAPMYRDGTPSGLAHIPRCRNHYDYALTEGREAPQGVARAWAEGRRVTSKVVAEALAEEQAARAVSTSKKRRAS